jgi:hypothetical protein
VPKVREAPAPQIVINPPVTTNLPSADPPKAEDREDREPGWFISDMMKIPANEWEKIYHLELQRLEPKVPGVAGSKGYLWTFFAPITYADVKKRWGGGKFRMDLCKNGHYWKTHNFDIEGEPIYDRSRELPPANGNGNIASNADFQREFISVLREELQRSRESNQGQPTGADKLVEMFVKANDKAVEMVSKQAPAQRDPADQVDKLLSAAEKLANLRQPNAGAGQSLGDKLLDKLIDKLLNPRDPIEELTKLSGLFDVLEKIRGDSTGGAPKDWKAAAVQSLTNHLPEILDALKTPAVTAQARAQEAAARARAAETLRTVPVHQPQQPPQAPAPAAAAAPPAPSIRVDGGLTLEPRETAGTGAGVEVLPLEHQPAPVPTSQEQYDEGMKIQCVNMMRYGASGSAIATFLEDVKPELAKDLVTFPEQAVTDFFLKDPILKWMVQDERWREVLAEAREYLNEAEEISVH